MKRIQILAAGVVALGMNAICVAQDPVKITLRQAVETGIANNLDVGQSGLQMETDAINWKQAQWDRVPDLNASGNNGINKGRSIDPFTNSYSNQRISYASYGVSSSVVLFNGLYLHHTAKRNQLAYQASKMDWQQAKDNLTIDIILAYLTVLNNEDLLAQSRNQAELSKKQVDRLDILNRDGAIPPSQLSDLRGQYANDQLNIISMQNALETSKVDLAQLMNVPYDKEMQLERISVDAIGTLYETSPRAIYQVALQQFAQVKAVDLRQQSAAKAVQAARSQLFPTLSLNGNVNTNYSNAARNDIFINTTDVTTTDYVVVNGNQTQVIRQQKNFSSQAIPFGKQLDNNLFTNISLNLRVPIFNSFQARNRIKLAKITLKQNELIAKTTKTQLQQFIEQAYINLTTASERYKTLVEQVDAFTESFRAAEIRFNSGLGTSIDYLTAKNNLDRAAINLISTKYDYELRTKILDYYQGKPLW